MQETNEKLYTDMGGVYFPFAVGAGSGMHTASVLKNGKIDFYRIRLFFFYLLLLMKETDQNCFKNNQYIIH